MKKPSSPREEATTASDRGSSARAPLQARGRARIETVLDAAAELIVEKGLTGVTMHGVARQARTPIGSMYHFFPDRDSLLNALWDRHMAATDEIEAELVGLDTDYWRGISAEAVIDRFMTPYITYLEQHPDCLILMSIMPHDDDHKNKRKAGTLRKVLDARIPGVKASERALYVDMLHALATGALAIKLRPAMGDVQLAGRYLREVRRALSAYLAAVEASIAG
ncbi:TetR/AcrR family transcriptional regulator [Caballeronia sp. LP006]|jgi:AcrR family transcriptional regulator|uniref:TetR/AcrR family transcriptional regulator n=1 Tax=unclassified Caballeronia TaxID=2646786 RepID=UPI001FD54591|nr:MULTISPECIES: TetR/AcrR family transcriptional regulator [unclassified Caballeronia]MDR5774243.1 TetR/AcrR family transcriptional regulator [Caballeronia sp. LZ002]MDR5805776.1 TetR/AcrR family transcriptional regulator [Caballeronia sp. LZ001]MDR5827020.1 TetR/AcrR family transcriptional regulator [Caballeronia sp. LP006]MDR5849678.1 TetR/AcrR family transcriptional regulator [Caballeronia sp. LZ003]